MSTACNAQMHAQGSAPFSCSVSCWCDLQINVADHSGSQWLTCFQDTGTEVLGVDAQQLGEMRDSDEAAFDEIFQKVNFRDFMFKIRAKMDTFNVGGDNGVWGMFSCICVCCVLLCRMSRD